MKWIKDIVIVLLIIAIAVIFFHSVNQKWKIEEVSQELSDWQDAYAELSYYTRYVR